MPAAGWDGSQPNALSREPAPVSDRTDVLSPEGDFHQRDVEENGFVSLLMCDVEPFRSGTRPSVPPT